MNIEALEILKITPLCDTKELQAAYKKALSSCSFDDESSKLAILDAYNKVFPMFDHRHTNLLHAIQSADDLNAVLRTCNPKTILTILEKLYDLDKLSEIMQPPGAITTILKGIPKNKALCAIIILRHHLNHAQSTNSSQPTFGTIITGAVQQGIQLAETHVKNTINGLFSPALTFFKPKETASTPTSVSDKTITDVLAVGRSLNNTADYLSDNNLMNWYDIQPFLYILETRTYVQDDVIKCDEITGEIVNILGKNDTQESFQQDVEQIKAYFYSINDEFRHHFIQKIPHRVAIQCINLLNHDASLSYQDILRYLPLSISANLSDTRSLFSPPKMDILEPSLLLSKAQEACNILSRLEIKQSITTNPEKGHKKFYLLLQIQNHFTHYLSILDKGINPHEGTPETTTPVTLSIQQQQLLQALLQLIQYVCQIETNVASDWTTQLTKWVDTTLHTNLTKTRSLRNFQDSIPEPLHTPRRQEQAPELEQHLMRYLFEYQLSPINTAMLLLCHEPTPDIAGYRNYKAPVP